MPYVHVELFEGRTVEQKAIIAKEITESISKHAGAPTSAIHVIFNDLPEGMLYAGNSPIADQIHSYSHHFTADFYRMTNIIS